MAREVERWSFAVITDLHIGRYYGDYGEGEGGDKRTKGQPYYLTERLDRVVRWINKHHNSQHLRFVAVLGDISDSGEPSQLEVAKSILDKLEIPYFPLLGNHDICLGPNTNKAPKPLLFFRAVFDNGFFRHQIERFDSSFCEQFVKDDSQFENYAFLAGRLMFVCLDFVSRDPAFIEKGMRNNAQLHSETVRWLEKLLPEYHFPKGVPIILFSHHPLLAPAQMPEEVVKQDIFEAQDQTEMALTILKASQFDLINYYVHSAFVMPEINELDRVMKRIEENGNRLIGNFAGHIHGFEHRTRWIQNKLVLYNGNEEFSTADTLDLPFVGVPIVTPLNMPVIMTQALMMGSNVEGEKRGVIRLVHVANGHISYDPKNATERIPAALNPNFRWRPIKAGMNQKVRFDSDTISTRACSYEWQIAKDERVMAVASGQKLKYSFGEAGEYVVTLIARLQDERGIEERITKRIEVVGSVLKSERTKRLKRFARRVTRVAVLLKRLAFK